MPSSVITPAAVSALGGNLLVHSKHEAPTDQATELLSAFYALGCLAALCCIYCVVQFLRMLREHTNEHRTKEYGRVTSAEAEDDVVEDESDSISK